MGISPMLTHLAHSLPLWWLQWTTVLPSNPNVQNTVWNCSSWMHSRHGAAPCGTARRLTHLPIFPLSTRSCRLSWRCSTLCDSSHSSELWSSAFTDDMDCCSLCTGPPNFTYIYHCGHIGEYNSSDSHPWTLHWGHIGEYNSTDSHPWTLHCGHIGEYNFTDSHPWTLHCGHIGEYNSLATHPWTL